MNLIAAGSIFACVHTARPLIEEVEEMRAQLIKCFGRI